MKLLPPLLPTALYSSFAWMAMTATTAQESAEFTAPTTWHYSAPLISPEDRDTHRSHAQKDPSVVFHDGRWHVFMTVKLEGRTALEYASFVSWQNGEPDAAKRTLLTVSDSDYFGAPQVFFFAPHQLWYLIYQVGMPQTETGAKSNKMWVAYSTTADISDPASWTKAKPMPGLDGGADDPRVTGGLDYWVICDDQRAYLFLTSLNGKMWRLSTALADFPAGFGDCQLALQAEIFEASHTYRIKGRSGDDRDQFVTLIEENGKRGRYFKAYLADRLDGEWRPLDENDSEENAFASRFNTEPAPGFDAWTDNFSHGELIRDGIDQNLVIDPAKLRFVFQGMLEKDKQAKGYGAFQWRIGLLTPVPTK
jgi:hypothetical protein